MGSWDEYGGCVQYQGIVTAKRNSLRKLDFRPKYTTYISKTAA